VLRDRSPLTPDKSPMRVRLAFLRHAASVRPEPGSNSPTTAQPAHKHKICMQENSLRRQARQAETWGNSHEPAQPATQELKKGKIKRVGDIPKERGGYKIRIVEKGIGRIRGK